MLIEPATGTVAREKTIDAWISSMVVHHEHLILVEQRLPAPHGVVRGLTPSLDEAWTHDLSEYMGHEEMFSDNRVWIRGERVPDGPALDRPRVRMVADGLTALWIGARTAFIDARTGELARVMFCSRLVDDGTRIWCNVGPRAAAFSYDLRQLFTTENGVRLAFPNRDPAYGDVSPAVFLRESGEMVRVDPATGETLGSLIDTSASEAFGMTIPPNVAYAGGHLVVGDNLITAGIDPDTGEVLWRQPFRTSLHELFLQDGVLIDGNREMVLFNPATGETIEQQRLSNGFGLSRVGEAFAAAGVDDIARIDVP